MYRSPVFIAIFLITAFSAGAQYPLVTIQQVQYESLVELSNCVDSSTYNLDTVRVRGIVMHHPDSARYTQAFTGAQMWIQDSSGPFRGLDIIYFSDPALIGMDALIPGDSVEITGYVFEYQDHETELIPIDGTQITVLGNTSVPNPVAVSLCDINDASQVNEFTTGEQWEGSYIELIGPLTVVSVTPFSSNTRVSFQVQDIGGCLINVTDKFVAGNMPVSSVPGNFVAPNVFDVYDTIRGILGHSPNGCTGQVGRGYELSPFTYKDYVLSFAAPSISNITRPIPTPNCLDSAQIDCDINHPLGTPIMKGVLYFATGVGSTNWDSVYMVNSSGSTWTGYIPGQPDGTFVMYYIATEDSSGNRSYNPNIGGGFADPKWYWTRCTGTEIYDLQFYPPTTVTSFNFSSGYEGMVVTVTGVVTASAESDNLGYVYIQQENRVDWCGIMVTGSASLSNLNMGDRIAVTAEVDENNGFTWLINASNISVNGSGTIDTTTLDPNIFTLDDYSTEPYEGMLVMLENASGGDMWVVDSNADNSGNFGEYRIGSDQFDPNSGCRILAGRQTSTAFSSLNFSYVNDSIWATTDGIMKVPVCVIEELQTITTLAGVMNFSFGNFKLTPRNNDDITGVVPCIVAWEEEMPGRFSVYPNPAGDLLHLKMDDSPGLFEVELTDLSGRTMLKTNWISTSGETEFHISHIPSGTYILKVADGDGNTVNRTKALIVR